MQPSEFWAADTWTVMDAFDGYAMSKGVRTPDRQPWTQAEMDELDRMIEADASRAARNA